MVAAVSKTETSGKGGRPKGLPRTGGRQKGTPNKATADIRALASVHGAAAIKELHRLSTKAESEGARIAAIKELLDRGFGKSPQPLTGEGGTGPAEIRITREIVTQ